MGMISVEERACGLSSTTLKLQEYPAEWLQFHGRTLKKLCKACGIVGAFINIGWVDLNGKHYEWASLGWSLFLQLGSL